MKKSQIPEMVITSLLFLLFIYASFSKYSDFEGFKISIHKQPFPDWFRALLVWTLPPAEIIVAGMLLHDRTRIAGLRLFIMLMSIFTCYIIAIQLHLFAYVPCSCGGVIASFSWGQHLAFNLFFISIGLIALRLHQEPSEPLTGETGTGQGLG